MNIDLHCHSTHSDGMWSVEAILREAEKKGVEVLSITDHDNFEGSLEAFRIAENIFSGKLVPGIEISTRVANEKVHFLAFFPTINLDSHKPLLVNLDKIKNDRVRRMEAMIRNAKNLGFDVSMEEVKEIASTGIDGGKQPSDVLSRPHLARVFINKGYVKDIDEAFDKYLAEGKSVHESRFSLSFRQWINQIKELDGVIIWAHPLFSKSEDKEKLKRIANILSASDIDGVERVYKYDGKYDISDEFKSWGHAYLDELIDKNNWLVTAGGDFHGDVGVLGELDLLEEHWLRFSSKLYGY